MNSHSCKSVNELLVEYADGELPADDARRVAAHLAECPECREELRLLERSLDLARTIWQQSASELSLPAALPVRPGRRWLRPAACVAVAALLMVSAAAWLAWYHQPRGNVPADRVAQVPGATTTQSAGPAGDTTTQSVVPGLSSSASSTVGQAARLNSPKSNRGTPTELPDSADIEAFIARHERAARLGAAAELLAAQPGLKEYTEQAERYLAENYGDTPAGQRAARRLAVPN